MSEFDDSRSNLIPPVERIYALDDLVRLRNRLRDANQSVVLTNGCFDILHRGHMDYLWQSSQLGDFQIVAVNSDESVRALKGPSRPINSQQDRAFVLASARCVDAVIVFHSPRLDAEITQLRPDVYTKAGDYTPETLDQVEKAALDAVGAQITIIPFSTGYSTTSTIEKMRVKD